MRKLKLKEADRPQLIGIKKKLDRREANRERKAEAAARIEKSIEKELIDRLKSKAYGDAPLNVNEDIWQKILDEDLEGAEEDESEEEDEEEEEEEEDEDEVNKCHDDNDRMTNIAFFLKQDVEFVSDLEDESEIEDIEDGFEWEQEEENENVALKN
jgi:protein MAK16